MKKKINSCLLLMLFLASCCSDSPTKFDSTSWKQWEETENTLSLRWNMRKDFLSRYKVIGMKKSEIISLLGEPENSSENYISYFLGHSGCGINTGSLSFSIKDNIVIDYNISDG